MYLLRGKIIIFISLCCACFVDGLQSLGLLAEPLFYLWLVIRNLWPVRTSPSPSAAQSVNIV